MMIVAMQPQRIDQVPRPFGSGCQPWRTVLSSACTDRINDATIKHFKRKGEDMGVFDFFLFFFFEYLKDKADVKKRKETC